MDEKTRVELITRKPTTEFLTEEELKTSISTGVPLKHYIGFEVSGRIHLGTALSIMKMADLQRAGVATSIFLADYHTWINNKLGGDLDFIRRVAKEYFGKIASELVELAGGKKEQVKQVLASDIYDNDYWATVVKVAKNTTLSRTLRSMTIMGRNADKTKSMPTAWALYPMMQAADIFFQGINLAHSGMDQRKIHVVAREAGMKVAGYKPMALHCQMLLGLHKPAVWPVPKDKEDRWAMFKMSKSVTGSAVYVDDSEKEIRKKIKDAFCPEKEIEYNPVLDWVEHLVFSPMFKDRELEIIRPKKFGGEVTYRTFESLQKDFKAGKLHPMDLKIALTDRIVTMLEPIRSAVKGSKIVGELTERITR
ncbi:MAG: tyrosine--tRNA ligase [Candidatus Altiarchaeota archaeon]|nr:tyrosine--tRNA ligase [Candidatus Altiarchaeota archaeon]